MANEHKLINVPLSILATLLCVPLKMECAKLNAKIKNNMIEISIYIFISIKIPLSNLDMLRYFDESLLLSSDYKGN